MLNTLCKFVLPHRQNHISGYRSFRAILKFSIWLSTLYLESLSSLLIILSSSIFLSHYWSLVFHLAIIRFSCSITHTTLITMHYLATFKTHFWQFFHTAEAHIHILLPCRLMFWYLVIIFFKLISTFACRILPQPKPFPWTFTSNTDNGAPPPLNLFFRYEGSCKPTGGYAFKLRMSHNQSLLNAVDWVIPSNDFNKNELSYI